MHYVWEIPEREVPTKWEEEEWAEDEEWSGDEETPVKQKWVRSEAMKKRRWIIHWLDRQNGPAFSNRKLRDEFAKHFGITKLQGWLYLVNGGWMKGEMPKP